MSRSVSCARRIAAVGLLMMATPAMAMDCVPLDDGGRLCERDRTLYYGEPGSDALIELDEEMLLGLMLLGLLAGAELPALLGDAAGAGEDPGMVIHGGDGGSISGRGACTMYSSPGYGFGESFSFSTC